jgi:subtilisin family serine protease
MPRKILQQSFSFFVLAGLVLSLVFSLPVAAAASPAQSAQTDISIQVENALTRQFETQGSAGYLIYFRSNADLTPASKMGWDERGQFVMDTLQEAARASQSDVKAYLDKQGVSYQSFWIDNVIVVDSSTSQVFNQLMSFPEIQSLKARRTMGVIEPEREPVTEHLFAIESNLTHINADDVWTMGYEGQGVTIANIDTGVRYTHQAVNAQYRGNLGGGVYEHNYNWFDPYGDHPTAPADDNGHGTHTMGTMVGDDGGSNQTGVAPGASWMACRACNTSSCTDAALLACAQFVTAPTDLAGANADPAKRPVAVNNSWGDCSTSYDNWYQGVVDAWQAAGIFPIFSNGNASNCGYSEPPGLNTVGNPARYGNVTGVGSSGQSNGQYATHSNWGPTDNLDTINPSPADAFGAALKPQVVAPGENIRSSVNTSDSSYESWAGTSMSAPHVTGLVALIVEAAPCLAGEYATIETILEDTAVAIPYSTGGSPAPPAGNAVNYATGHGEIDALAAVNMALGLCGESILSGTVTSSATGNPIAGATVDIVDLTTSRHTTTNAAGFYTINLFDGTYDLTFSKYGYVTQTINGVALVGTATQNAALATAPISTISGVVTDADAGWPVYARINIAGYPGDPIFTDPLTGAYSVDLIDASYTFTVSAMSGGYTDTVAPIVVSGNATEDFTLAVDAACTAPGYAYNGFAENFESWPLTGWTIVDNIVGGSLAWADNDTYGEGNYTGGAGWAATVSSDANPYAPYNTELRTPVLNLASLPSLTLQYKANYQDYSTFDALDLDISVNGGTDWTNISHWTTDHGALLGAGENVSVNLTSYATANFMLRWRYYTSEVAPYDWYAEIDDVSFAGTTCAPIASTGLVIGAVYDANTSALVMSASVQDAALNTALLIDASADPAAPDQMYLIAEPAGAVTLTASATGYGSDTKSPTVIAGDTVGQDFNLSSPSLSYAPPTLEVTLSLGESTTIPFTLTNNGGQAATFELVERNGGFTPASLRSGQPTVTQAAGPSLPSARHAPAKVGFSAPIHSINPAALLFSEGFEGGVVPPTGWTEVVTNASYNWKITTTGTPYAGAEAADVEYDPALVQQNEWLLSPELNISEGTLSFWSNGSVYWCRDTYDNCDLNVWIVVGTVGGGDDILVGKGDTAWPANWTWAQSTFDLTSLLPGGPVRIGFQYEGADGAQVVLDEIVLDGTEGSLDIPWLSASPLTGSIPAGNNQVINVTFDASALTAIGQYDATLRIMSNDPINPSVAVPVTLTLTAGNSAPVINSDGGGATASKNVVENTTAVTTVTATDVDLDTLAYSISGGADAALFSINASTGVLTFISAPDFENPADVGSNNTYEVIVQVSDGSLTDTQTITVTVTNINEILELFLPLIMR